MLDLGPRYGAVYVKPSLLHRCFSSEKTRSTREMRHPGRGLVRCGDWSERSGMLASDAAVATGAAGWSVTGCSKTINATAADQYSSTQTKLHVSALPRPLSSRTTCLSPRLTIDGYLLLPIWLASIYCYYALAK